MTVVSMTGFADSAGGQGGLHWRWEAKSVNGRGLDLRLRLPPGFDGLEAAARTLAGERFKRGNIQVTLNLETADSAKGLNVDPVALAAAVRIAREIERETGLPAARIDGLLALKGVVVAEGPASDPAERAARDAALLESLALCFDALARARSGEGAKLAGILRVILNEIEQLAEQAQASAALQPKALRERLMAQLSELIESGSVPEERLAQEVALLALKADIREELDRLGAHIQEARALLASGEAIGRRLDFLAQEFNREANTLCSKSSDIALTRIGLGLKAAIDQLREQVQNVE